MTNTSVTRAVTGLVAIVLTAPAIGLTGPAIAGGYALPGAAVRSTLAAQRNGSTFTEASVTRSASAGYVVRWRSAAKRVTVSATTDRSGAGSTLVGAGGANGVVTVEGLPDAARTYFKLEANTGETIIVAERSLRLPHAANARDLGGYRTSDGQWVRPGLLFRSNRLSALNDSEVSYLEQLGVAHVIDFRSPIEIQAKPDRVPNGAEYSVFSIVADNDPQITATVGDLDTFETMQMLNGAPGIYTSLYQQMATSPRALGAYRQFFQELVDAEGSTVLFHCTYGQDRAGWAAFVLLRLLGVPKATAMHDYLESNGPNAPVHQGYAAYYADALPPELNDWSLQAAYIDEGMRAVNAMYGSFDQYVRVGLGISDAEADGLRATYLN